MLVTTRTRKALRRPRSRPERKIERKQHHDTLVEIFPPETRADGIRREHMHPRLVDATVQVFPQPASWIEQPGQHVVLEVTIDPGVDRHPESVLGTLDDT